MIYLKIIKRKYFWEKKKKKQEGSYNLPSTYEARSQSYLTQKILECSLIKKGMQSKRLNIFYNVGRDGP